MILLYTTFDSIEQAKNCVHQLLEAKLIACANIHSKGLSIYSWKNQIHEDEEIYVYLKTTEELEAILREKLDEIHPYDCPCLITITPESVNPEYLAYIQSILET